MLRRLAANIAHRLPFNAAPLGEIGKRAGRRGATTSGERAADECLHVVVADTSARTAAGDVTDVDAQLAGQPSDGRSRGWRRSLIDRLGGSGRGRCRARAATDVDDLTAPRLGFR